MYIHTYLYVHEPLYIYICVYICLYTYIYTHIYKYIYVMCIPVGFCDFEASNFEEKAMLRLRGVGPSSRVLTNYHSRSI